MPATDCGALLPHFPFLSFLSPDESRRFWQRQSGDVLERNIHLTTGTVKFFNAAKGFGFISPDGDAKDVFVHISAVERAGLHGLNDGQKISFDVESGRDGRLSAVNLVAA